MEKSPSRVLQSQFKKQLDPSDWSQRETSRGRDTAASIIKDKRHRRCVSCYRR